MSLTQSGPVSFCQGEVWRAVYRNIYITKDDGLLSFIANDWVLCLPAILRVSFAKVVPFFLPRPADDRFHTVGAQCDPAIPSSASLVPHSSSPCLDANEEIGLQATESLDCLTLQLCQTNQMWGGEPSELLVAKGYQITIGVKPLHIAEETFCLIPTDDVNCCYLDSLISEALAARRKPTKKGSGGGVLAFSLMLKSAKRSRRNIRKFDI